jgi:hypothetical protein
MHRQIALRFQISIVLPYLLKYDEEETLWRLPVLAWSLPLSKRHPFHPGQVSQLFYNEV